VSIGTGRQRGPLRLDYGPTWADLECDVCGATWVGELDDPCGWCEDRAARDLQDVRRAILWPDWSIPQGERYDDLSELDRLVWDTTRGIRRGAAVEHAWAERLRQAVEAGIITPAEAEAVINRIGRVT
jgi:hypothetical protein